MIVNLILCALLASVLGWLIGLVMGYGAGRDRERGDRRSSSPGPERLEVLHRHVHSHAPQLLIHTPQQVTVENDPVEVYHHNPEPVNELPDETDVEAECNGRYEQGITTAQDTEQAVREQFRKILEEEAGNCAPMRRATAEEANACCGK